jgi:ankyrin repeat protein
MAFLTTEDPCAVAAATAIHTGDVAALRRLLAEHPELAGVQLGDPGMSRSLLHVATDWPGHYPNSPATVAALVAAGADVHARFTGPHTETPLHWAASSDDVAVLDALLDAGADIEAPGAVIAGGTPLDDAVAFGQWQAARRLVERGARTRIWHAAALGLLERVTGYFDGPAPPSPDDVTHAFWSACHGGQQQTAEYLLEHGAELNWVGYDNLTPFDAARRAGANALVAWLHSRGGRCADEVGQPHP